MNRSSSRLAAAPERLGAPRWRAQAALAWLMLALVLVPALGRLHQMVHAEALAQAHAGHAPAGGLAAGGTLLSPRSAALAPTAAAVPSQDDHVGGPALSLLLGSHTPLDCLLLDQLALGDALQSAPPVLSPSVPPHGPATHPTAPHWATQVAVFHARGPPPA